MRENKKLLELLRKKAVVRGHFVLTSGKTSDYYIDARLVTLDPEGAGLVARAILRAIEGDKMDAIGGMAVAAVPIAAAVALESAKTENPLRGFFVRSAQKTHGMQKLVEGPVRKGDRVLIVEDTLSTGGSALQAAEAAGQAGLVVVKILAIVDRLMGGAERIREAGYDFSSLFTKDEQL